MGRHAGYGPVWRGHPWPRTGGGSVDPTGKRQPANQRGCFFCHRERKEEGKRKKTVGPVAGKRDGQALGINRRIVDNTTTRTYMYGSGFLSRSTSRGGRRKRAREKERRSVCVRVGRGKKLIDLNTTVTEKLLPVPRLLQHRNGAPILKRLVTPKPRTCYGMRVNSEHPPSCLPAGPTCSEPGPSNFKKASYSLEVTAHKSVLWYPPWHLPGEFGYPLIIITRVTTRVTNCRNHPTPLLKRPLSKRAIATTTDTVDWLAGTHTRTLPGTGTTLKRDRWQRHPAALGEVITTFLTCLGGQEPLRPWRLTHHTHRTRDM